MSKISPALLYGDRAEEALDYYCGIFPDAIVTDRSRYPDGKLLAATLEMGGQTWTLINGYEVPFHESVSFMVSCADQAEVDHYWDSLTAGDGRESQCGWLFDRFGMAWQIVPTRLPELMGDSDPVVAQAAMQAMMGMTKIVIADLESAVEAAVAASGAGS
ncbi:VOC family protein [Frondihabitans australicus]|uniref:Putative 3-demethylubiquinone-9 3-methyltransferase (Glyoxalase superfamily) n=1 Tax=Frondihabitans australicus TaxID=386892 RepID=A0A495IAA7_9MICO|nr:VOC family protein [Frondihabitans australicus]RKR72944.1 putative 3-demethylubiquinone-9 3-methyltransferase (glyoxalase superfamily) [Frondihabitans australicus]